MGSNLPGKKWFVHDEVVVEIAARLWTQPACVGTNPQRAFEPMPQKIPSSTATVRRVIFTF
jgi:hypothetical protein